MDNTKLDIIKTIYLIIPYFSIGIYFYLYKKDSFFLKIRSSVQLLIILIFLGLSFTNIVLWKAFFENYTFLNFDIENKANHFKSTALVTAMAAIAAVFGWIFTSRVQILNTNRTHSIQVLMNSRNSSVYMDMVKQVSKLRRYLQENKLQSLSKEEFLLLDDNDNDKKTAIIYLLNFLEFVSLGVRHNNLDEDLIRGSFRTIVKTNYELFSPVIIYLREQDGNKIYEQLEILHKRWDNLESNYKYCKCDKGYIKYFKFLFKDQSFLNQIILVAITAGIWIPVFLILRTMDFYNFFPLDNLKCIKCAFTENLTDSFSDNSKKAA